MKPIQQGAVIGSLAALAGVSLMGVLGFEQAPKQEERANPPRLIDSIHGPAL